MNANRGESSLRAGRPAGSWAVHWLAESSRAASYWDQPRAESADDSCSQARASSTGVVAARSIHLDGGPTDRPTVRPALANDQWTLLPAPRSFRTDERRRAGQRRGSPGLRVNLHLHLDPIFSLQKVSTRREAAALFAAAGPTASQVRQISDKCSGTNAAAAAADETRGSGSGLYQYTFGRASSQQQAGG